MIREYQHSDEERILEIHLANSLPANCFLNIDDPLVMIKGVVEQDGKAVMASFVKGTGELFLFVDHEYGTPEERWKMLQEFKEYVVHQAWLKGLDQLTCWVPPEIDKTFRSRLEELGFVRSEWPSYTLNVET